MSIISKTDNIPAKRIVKALETIVIRSSEMWSITSWNEAKAMERIMQKAKQMGANAVVNFIYKKKGTHISCTGLGVIVEDIDTGTSHIRENNDIKFCENCGNKMQSFYKFCPFCGAE